MIEEKDGKLKAFKFKLKNKKVNFPKTFLNAYNAETYEVDIHNFTDFVSMEE